jgi:hypothetical protein
MKKTILFLSLIIFVFCIYSFKSKNIMTLSDNEKGDSTKTTKPKVIDTYTPLLGCTQASSTLPIADILALCNNNICVMNDKTKAKYKVHSYDFNYCERGLFEDSTGLPTIITEVHFEECKGDSICTKWKKMLAERLYKNDTLRISAITINTDKGVIKIPSKLVMIAK